MHAVAELNTRQPIRDDSHAKAILKRELRRVCAACDAPAAQAPRKALSRRRQFAAAVAALRARYRACIVEETVRPSRRRSSSTVEHTFLLLDPCSRLSNPALAGTVERRNLALTVATVSSKRPWLFGFEPLALVSEHAVERVILRSQCHDWESICAAMRPLFSSLAALAAAGACDAPMALLTAEGYATVKRTEDHWLLMTTWIPRHRWHPRQEAKLHQLASTLDGSDRVLAIPAGEFNDACYFDPAGLAGRVA